MNTIYFGVVTNEHYVTLKTIEFATWDERYGAWKFLGLMRESCIEPLYMWSVDVIIDDNYDIKEIKPYGIKLNYSMTLTLKKRLNELGYYIT